MFFLINIIIIIIIIVIIIIILIIYFLRLVLSSFSSNLTKIFPALRDYNKNKAFMVVLSYLCHM